MIGLKAKNRHVSSTHANDNVCSQTFFQDLAMQDLFQIILPGNQQNLSHEISTTVSKRYVNEGCLTHMEHILKMGFQGLLISDASDIYFLISPDLLGVSP